jgi:hypothetical protein
VEKTDLDMPPYIEELEKSMDLANTKFLPSIDGISNVFLKEFWRNLRAPLLRYCDTLDTLKMGPSVPSGALCPLYSPLSPLRPSVPFEKQ